jgi:peptidyl-prolyl cis-trans isomerase SurA
VDGSPAAIRWLLPSWRAIARLLTWVKQAGKSGNQEYGFVGFMLSEGRTALESRPHKYIGVEMLTLTSVCTPANDCPYQQPLICDIITFCLKYAQEGIPMKKQLWIIPALLFGFCTAEAAKTVDRILAKVNDDIITLSELNRTLADARKELSAKFSGARLEQELKKAEKKALDYLIEDKLLYQKAVEMEYHTRAEPKVSSYIKEAIKKGNYKDEDDLEQALLKQGGNLREFREEIQRQISIDELKNDFVGSRISLLGPELARYYEEHLNDYTNPEVVGLSEIVITIEGGRKEAEDQANELYGRLQKGAKFPDLASQYSKGRTAPKGGDIGSIMINELNPEITKAIANYKEGEVTKPQLIKTGYVIFHIDSRKAATVRPLSEVLDDVKQKLGNKKFEPEFERFITQLREDAYIEYFTDVK